MKATVRHEMSQALRAYEDKPLEEWIMWHFVASIVALTSSQIRWAFEVELVFSRLEEGMKQYNEKQVHQLNTLISKLTGQLSPGDRQKIRTVCTFGLHTRDVEVENSQHFLWQSELRHRWDETDQECFVNIC
uniref:Uncharacterized protein n=1 Tax=Denticeps clupeoides TaxID=299321 RepID=A0AAY4C1B1_9TELE